jgi:hypothetical protein
MIRVMLLVINNGGFLLMSSVEFIIFGAYLIERSPKLKKKVNKSEFLL